MKVFISWSGELSRDLAEVLRDWLPSVIQVLQPWISARDVEKGARWTAEIAKELEAARAGILCLTADNLEAPWLMYEAGALSKSVDSALVSPYLFGIGPAELKRPLADFQATEATRDDTRKLLGTLNSAVVTGQLSEKQLDATFEVWWPRLEAELGRLSSGRTPDHRKKKVVRSDREILEEILELAREQSKLWRSKEERSLYMSALVDSHAAGDFDGRPPVSSSPSIDFEASLVAMRRAIEELHARKKVND